MPELTILSGTGSGNTSRMAKAIEKGVRGAGVGVSIKKVETSTPKNIINADAVAIAHDKTSALQ